MKESSVRPGLRTPGCREAAARLSRLRCGFKAVLIAGLMLSAAPVRSEQPYQIRYADPITERWNFSRFPELKGQGLRCLAEDGRGHVWFGLEEGALEFDGYHWRRHGTAEGLPEAAVDWMVQRAGGQIAAATTHGIFEQRHEHWIRIFPRTESAPFRITALAESADGTLWACCRWGLIQLGDDSVTLLTSDRFAEVVADTGLFDAIRILPDDCLPLTSASPGTGVVLLDDRVAFLGPDSAASAAGIRSRDRILRIEPDGENFDRALQRRPGLELQLTVERHDTGQHESVRLITNSKAGRYRSPATHSIMEDSNGRLWAGLLEGGLLMSSDGGLTWQRMLQDMRSTRSSRPAAMETADGEIWVFSSGADVNFHRYDGSRWHGLKLSQLAGNAFVSAAAETADGTVWVGGMNRMHLYRRGEWVTYDTRDLKLPGESHRMLVTSDNALWIAGYNQSVVRIEICEDVRLRSVEGLEFFCRDQNDSDWFIETETRLIVRRSGSEAVSYDSADQVIANPQGILVVPDSGEVLAFGGHQGQAAVASFDGQQWTRTTFPVVSRGLSDRAFTVTRDGDIWIGAKGKRRDGQVGGLVARLDGKWQHFAPPDAPPYCTSIMELPDGRILLGGGFGAYQFDGSSWKRLTGSPVHEIACPSGTADSAGTAWLATRIKGVVRYQNDNWRTFSVEDGLLDDELSTVYAGPEGDIWCSTRDGLCRFDGSRFYPVDLPENLGRQSIRDGGDGNIWFDGQYCRRRTADPPQVIISQTSLKVESGGDAVVTYRGVDKWNRTPPRLLGWSWRINGGAWSRYASRNQIVLSNLPAGDHQVELRARDSDFNLSQVSTPIAVSVLPPFWLRPWFLSAVALVGGVLVWQSASLIRNGIALRVSNQQLREARRQLADDFAEKSAQFRAVCDCSPVGIFVTDSANQLTYYNQYLSTVTGLPAHVPGTRLPVDERGWLQAVHVEDRSRVFETWRLSRSQLGRFQSSGRFVLSNGSVRWFDAVAVPMQRNGDLLGYVGVLEDVTEKVMSGEQLRQTNVRLQETLDQLQQAQQQAIRRERLNALGQMAAGVAHDINNALTPLLCYTEMLEIQSNLTGECREWLQLIRLGISDTAGSVKRLDHFYRESHNRRFLESVNLAEIVTQTVELTRPRWHNSAMSEGRQIELRLDVLAEPTVHGDPTQLRSALTNLIFNAVDAIDREGEIAVRVRCEDDTAVVEVIDSGMGMQPEQLQRCTDPFFTSKSSGSGLGLSECHGILRQHGGEMQIESEPGRGTCVSLKLPCADPELLDNEFERFGLRSADSSESSPESSVSAVRSRILYIDDNECVRESTVAFLSLLGLDVETCGDGPTGLQLLEAGDFQLLLCDQGLPGMDGLSVLKEVKSRWPDLPVLLVSGWSLPKLEHGVEPDGFLEKPYALADLKQLVEAHLPESAIV